MAVIKFEMPEEKKASEMVVGDIFRTAYGDYDNVVEAVFVDAYPVENHTHIVCSWINSGNTFVMVSLEKFENATFEVVGKIA